MNVSGDDQKVTSISTEVAIVTCEVLLFMWCTICMRICSVYIQSVLLVSEYVQNTGVLCVLLILR